MRRPAFGRGQRSLRIAYGRLFHEACAHSPLLTERDSFERMHHLSGLELERASSLRGTELASFMPHAELTGFRQAARLAQGVETVPLQSSLAVPSGPLSADCFDWLLDGLIGRLGKAGRLNGVYLALHGAMQVEGLQVAPESVILARVRDALGPNVQLAVSYDLHANISAGLLDPVDVLIGYRTNPHWDLAPTGFRAGNRLIRSLRGQCQPTHAWRKLPMVIGGGLSIDFLSPMRQVFRWMRKLERDPAVLSASLFMVHPYTNAQDLGWTAHVCTDGDSLLADELACQLADRAWAQRDAPLPPLHSIDQALAMVRSRRWPKLGPVTFVDIGDIVGAGAPGGNTRVVEALVNEGGSLKAYVPVHDPALVNELWNVSSGTHRTITLRGTPHYNQPEVVLDAVVGQRAGTELGRVIRLDVGSFHIAISDHAPLPIHPSFWKRLGLRPRRADIIVQKNFFHYRLFYAATSFRHLAVISDGATSLDRIHRRSYQVPTWPIDSPADWRPHDPALRAGFDRA